MKSSDQVHWVAGSAFASVLGCVESAEICDPRFSLCLKLFDRSDDELLFRYISYLQANLKFAGFALAYRALVEATVLTSIGGRGADALNAQFLIDRSTGISGALHPEQWKVEARQIFETSLSRALVEAVDNANGAGADIPGAMNAVEGLVGIDTPCPMVKVGSNGHKSVSLWGLILILTGSFLVVLISINPDDEFVVLDFLTDKFMIFARFVESVATKAVHFTAKKFEQCKRRFQRWRRRPRDGERRIYLE